MSGALILPPPSEQPDERVDVIQTVLRVARDSLSIASERVAKLQRWEADALNSWSDRMTIRIQRQGRQLEVTLWTLQVEQLENALRALGVEP